MSRSFDVQINARRIKFVKTCINVIIITLFYTNCTCAWFGKNELRLYLNGAKISSIGGRPPRPHFKYSHASTREKVMEAESIGCCRWRVVFDHVVISLHIITAYRYTYRRASYRLLEICLKLSAHRNETETKQFQNSFETDLNSFDLVSFRCSGSFRLFSLCPLHITKSVSLWR